MSTARCAWTLVGLLAIGCGEEATNNAFGSQGSNTDGPDTSATEGSTGPMPGSTSMGPSTGGDEAPDPDGSSDGGNKFDVGAVPDPPGSDDGDGCSKVDFLFVIDTSGSMGQEQEALRLAYPGFIQGIQAAGIADYHVAVTTADMGGCGSITGGDRGEFQWLPASANPECYPLAERFISGPSDASTSEFQCIAEIFGGSGHEQPLQGAYAALIDRIQDGSNPYEFRRDDALLVVMYITDEDDQSLLQGGTECGQEPVSLYTDLYEAAVLKGNLTAGVFIAISGPAGASCSSPGLGSASPAPRLNEFINHWGERGFWANICDGDFPAALSGALETIELGCDGFDPEG